MTRRAVTTLDGTIGLRLQVRRCRDPLCPRYRAPLRPEQEGRSALPGHEFGLDIIALVGTLRHAQHRSVPGIHLELARRGVAACLRTVTHLRDRHDEPLALSLPDAGRLRRITAAAGRVIPALDGLQPAGGHEVLWVIRAVRSGEVLLARSLRPSTQDDLARLITEVKEPLGVPIVGVISDGQERALLGGGLAATEAMGAPVEAAYAWVVRAAAILANAAGPTGAAVKASYRGLLGAMSRHAERAGDLAGALEHFGKVTRSDWPGLLPGYDVPDLPRTDNDLEPLFGSHRNHERRASGREMASPGLVVRGSVRLAAAVATRLRGEVRGEELAPSGPGAWRELRAGLERRQEIRAQGRRFRRDPAAYLRAPEDSLIKETLPT